MAHSIHFIETISLSPYRIPYNSWITSAQHLMCGLQLHRFQEQTLYLPTTSIIYFDNFSYCFQSLILLLTTAYPITYNNLTYYLQQPTILAGINLPTCHRVALGDIRWQQKQALLPHLNI